MNIFFLDSCPVNSAQYLCDKHVVKMVLESAQLLSTAWRLLNKDFITDSIFYKITHKNHPCSVWVRNNSANYNWVCKHALALCYEYKYRYNKNHKCYPIIVLANLNRPQFKIYTTYISKPPLAMPDKYKSENYVRSYRDYYLGEKMKFAKWTKRNIPFWIKEQ